MLLQRISDILSQTKTRSWWMHHITNVAHATPRIFTRPYPPISLCPPALGLCGPFRTILVLSNRAPAVKTARRCSSRVLREPCHRCPMRRLKPGEKPTACLLTRCLCLSKTLLQWWMVSRLPVSFMNTLLPVHRCPLLVSWLTPFFRKKGMHQRVSLLKSLCRQCRILFSYPVRFPSGVAPLVAPGGP